MVSLLFFSQLVLFTLIWLFVILHLTWPKRAVIAPASPALPEPLKPKRTRANERKAFEGLTHKPHYALCERDTVQSKAPPPTRPDPMPPTHRRPREVDTSMHFCPHSDCDYRGWLELGNLRANGHPSGGPWRQFYCTSCHGYFLKTHGTIFHGKQASVELIVRAVACLAEGLGIRATARVFEVDPNTVLQGSVTKRFLCIPGQSTYEYKTRGEEQGRCPPRGEADAQTRKPCHAKMSSRAPSKPCLILDPQVFSG